jgi:hypothetical protein
MGNIIFTKESTTFHGQLTFISFFHPVIIDINGVKNNIRQLFFNRFSELDGKPVSMEEDRNEFKFYKDEGSEYFLTYNNDKGGMLAWAEKKVGIGGFNLLAYLPGFLQQINSRCVGIEFFKGGFKILVDPDEDVFGVYYTGNANHCKVEDKDVKSVCKAGTSNCCIFLVAGGSGFECAKFDTYVGRQLLYRHGEGKLNATRIGNCKLLGRKE